MTHSALARQLGIRAAEILRDGQWHDLEDVLRELIKLIPPGMALRTADAVNDVKANDRRARGIPVAAHPTRPRLPLAARIGSGARAIALQHLRSSTAYETVPGTIRVHGRRLGGRVRMVKTHRALKGDPYLIARDRLEHENELLRERIILLRDLLTEYGHGAIIEELGGNEWA